MNSNVQAAMPKFAGLSHVCIFVDDMMEAVDYYQKLLGVVPDHYLSHWRNEGFFKAGGFVKEAADGDVSIAFVNVPGTKLTLELMQYHSPEGRKEPVFFAANDVSGARHVALKITNIDEAFLHIKSMPDTRLINETDDYQVFQISETYPDEVHFFDQDMKEMDERKQQTAKILSEVRYFYFIDKYGLQWEFEQGHTDIGEKKKKYPASLHWQGCSHCLLVEIFQRYQLNFTTLLCLKKSIRESAFREDIIIIIVVAFSKYRCVIPNQIEFIHTNFFISVLT